MSVNAKPMEHVRLAPLVAQRSVEGEALLVETDAALELADDVHDTAERP